MHPVIEPKVTAFLFAIATCISTGIGGWLAIRFKDRLRILLGFSAGALVALALFELLPEVFSETKNGRVVMAASAVGFLSLFLLERFTMMHKPREHSKDSAAHEMKLGVLSAAGLSIHSFLDGLAIGVGFNHNFSLGLTIAMAVILHDMSDGLNTVTVVMAHGNSLRRCVIWLIVDMLAPVLGVLSTIFIKLPVSVFPWLLAFFSGFFLYMGASDLLPEARESKSPAIAIAMIIGMVLVYVVTQMLPG